MSQQTAPYGTWKSPYIDSDTVVDDNYIVFDDVVVDPVTKAVYHLEERPKESGRCAIVITATDEDVFPSPYSARDSVNDYGGAPAIVYNNIVYFSNDYGDENISANSIYAKDVQDVSAVPRRVTPDNPKWRYANFAVHPKETQLLVTIREDHTNDPKGETPENVDYTLCVVDTNNATVTILTHGADFYATPVFNPSGTKIAWQEWYLPDMPWEGGIIYVADVFIVGGTIAIANHVLVAGVKKTVSATYPSWITDTTLLYVSDKDNRFQNPFIFDTETQQSQSILNTEDPARRLDFCEPAWWLGYYPYAILDGGRYGAFTAFEDGRNILFFIDLRLKGFSKPVRIDGFDYVVAQHLRPVDANTFVFTGLKSDAPGGVILGTVSGTSGSYTASFDTLKANAPSSPAENYISKPIPKTLTADDGHTIYVVYYPPYSPDYSGPSDPTEKPPCIINVHGGPTGLEPQALNWTKMFYTSRGFAWLDVNYRGSSGYGRDYIELLNGNWGIYDVADCNEAAKKMSADPTDPIDLKRVAIRGGSAGAYTTLSSLTFAPDPGFYKTACSAYGGVADPTYLTKIVEKFESQYMYTLFGSLPDKGAWDSRNPSLHVAGNFSVPLYVLHGCIDGVVPITVIEEFVQDVTTLAPSVPIGHTYFEGEGHHFHQADHIKEALDTEHNWYYRYLLGLVG